MLRWGWSYLAVEPRHFRVDYAINPYMDPADQPDHARAERQWRDLVATMERYGARVASLPQPADCPDMVYAMNLGLALTGADPGSPEQRTVLLSHMRHPQRRDEQRRARDWFGHAGFAPVTVGSDGVGPHVEAGDAFPFGDALVVGYGPRTDRLALKHLATEAGTRVRGLGITHPGMYHLDLAFCPLDERRAMVCPDALDRPSATVLLDLVPEPLVLSEAEALTFCANSVVVGSTVVMPACPGRVRAQLEDWGFDVVVVDVGEFHKGGGSVRCLTNPLDITLGRDLPRVPGGEVLLS